MTDLHPDSRVAEIVSSPLKSRRSAYLLVGLLAGLVYLNSLPNQFAYDDVHIVVRNDGIQTLSGLPAALLQPYWPDAHGREMGLWRPATTGLLGLEYAMGGGAPMVFHAANTAGHVIVSLLLLALLLELMPLGAAFAGAIIFAVHPVHAEAVANVVGLSEILSTFAVVAASLIHVRSGSTSSWGRASMIAVLYLIGFGAKESAVTLPGVILLLDAARGHLTVRGIPRYLSERWRAYLLMAGVAAGLLTARFAILGTVANPLAPLGAGVLREIPRIWTLGDVWQHYVRLWIFPLDLSSDYAPDLLPISFGWHAGNTAGAALMLLLLGLAAVAWRRAPMGPGMGTARAAAFGAVWFGITISPTSNTVFLSGILLAERTLYLPSVGLAAATGWLFYRIARDRPRGAWVALAVVVALSSVRTWTRNPTWYDNATMFTALVRDYPQSGRAQWVLGDVALGRGNESDALRSYRAAVDLLDSDYQLVTEVANKLMGVERYRAAEGLLLYAVRDQPRYALAWSRLAFIRAEFGDAQGAERYVRESLDRYPPDPTGNQVLAWALAAQGRLIEAEEARARAEEHGDVTFWQTFVYDAIIARAAGDSLTASAALDTAWERALTSRQKASLDSVRVAEFGLDPLLVDASVGSEPAFAPDRR
jgi:protein O-mannosyl-transferase